MFLITTADQRFWRTDEPILFLGEWCKIFSQRSVWEKLSYEVLPYHWDDRKKLYKDYLYLQKLYERILPLLSKCLNQIHDVDHSVRYWRIIIGPWLYYFIQVLYDRYQLIIYAERCGKVTDTLITKCEQGNCSPRDFREFDKWVETDQYNHYLYSRIIEYQNRFPFSIFEEETDIDAKATDTNNKKMPLFVNRTLRLFFTKLYEKLTNACSNKVTLVSVGLDTWDLVKLHLSLHQLPYLSSPTVIFQRSEIDLGLREKLSYSASDNEFEQMLFKMIKDQIPTVYMEDYHQANQLSLDSYPKRPELIVTSFAFNSNDTFKFWAAHHVDRGIKFVGTQHGGHDGTGLWSATEDHEIRIFYKFFTWGWKLNGNDNIKPFPSAKLNKASKSRPKRDGNILLVLCAIPRYSYHMYSIIVSASGFKAYLHEQYRFVSTLTDENKKLLLVRLYLHDYGWSQKDRWKTEFPEIECYLGNKSLMNQLNESRLFIGTYNATTYLETFAVNFPTVLFWNPEHWEIRPKAKPYFEELHRVGILHYTPESAAAKVNEISEDPISWWHQTEIQEAKDQFCFQFARTSDNWLREWRSELLNMAQNS